MNLIETIKQNFTPEELERIELQANMKIIQEKLKRKFQGEEVDYTGKDVEDSVAKWME